MSWMNYLGVGPVWGFGLMLGTNLKELDLRPHYRIVALANKLRRTKRQDAKMGWSSFSLGSLEHV